MLLCSVVDIVVALVRHLWRFSYLSALAKEAQPSLPSVERESTNTVLSLGEKKEYTLRARGLI